MQRTMATRQSLDLPEPAASELGFDGHPHVVVLSRELAEIIGAREEWREERDALVRDFNFRDFDEAWGFVQQIAGVVDYERRPDMHVSMGHVRLTIANRNGAGITLAELRLAAKVDAVVDGADH
jgi:4a-hydroxytetrahydrobiopterin dehydratase